MNEFQPFVNRLAQVRFKEGKPKSDSKVIGDIEVERKRDKVVLVSYFALNIPRPKENWLCLLHEKESCYIADPFKKVSNWDHFQVEVNEGYPSLGITRYKGIRKVHSKLIECSKPEDLKQLPEDIPNRERAIFARLWNIYRQREALGD